MPDSVEAVPVAASRAKIVEALVRLGRAAQKTSIYPEGHPAIPAAVVTFIEALRQAIEERGVLSLGLASDRILVDGESIETKNAVVSWLAQHLHERGIGAIELSRVLPEADGIRFVQWLARPMTAESPAEPPSFEGITLTRYDYALARFGESPSADADVRADPVRAWTALMSGLFGGYEAPTTSSFDWSDPEALAKEISTRLARSEPISAAPPVAQSRPVPARQDVPSKPETPASAVVPSEPEMPTASAVASRVIAMGSQIGALPQGVRQTIKGKVAAFIGALTPELREELLRVDPHSSRQKLEFVTEMVDALPSTTVLEVLGDLDRTGAHVPHQFITLMNKLIGLSANDGTLKTQVGAKLESIGIPSSLMQAEPEKVRGVLEEVMHSRLAKTWNPERYQALLEDLSSHRVASGSTYSTDLYGDPLKPEQVKSHVAEIVLRLLVSRPEAPEAPSFVRCLDEDAPRALQEGRYEQVHEAASSVREIAGGTLDLTPEFRNLAGAYMATFTKEEQIEKILTGATQHDGPLTDWMVGLFRIAGADAIHAAFQKLVGLDEGPEAGRLRELLIRADAEAFTAALARLRPEGWTSLRVLFPVLQRIGGTRAVEMALTFVGNEDDRVRTEAFRVLLSEDRRPGQAERYIERALADDSQRVTFVAIAHARQRGGPGVTAILGSFLRSPSGGRDEELRLRAISALGSFRTAEARDILISQLSACKLAFWVKQVRISQGLEAALVQIGDELSLAAVQAWRRSPARWLSLLLVRGKVES